MKAFSRFGLQTNLQRN